MNRPIYASSVCSMLLLGLSSVLPAQGSWQEIPTFGSRTAAKMTYDSAHQRIFCFSGSYTGLVEFPNNLWEWEGAQWKARQTTIRPRGRVGPGLEYSDLHQGVLLYGGYTMDPLAPFAGVRFVNDTWLWDGRKWTQLKPKFSPTPGRRFFSMAHDPSRKRMVVFGGDISLGANAPIDETWEFDGKTWAQILPKNKPTPRHGAAMAYNRKSGKILLFGGFGQQGNTLGDTWEWDGTDWTKLAGPVTGLGTRGASIMLAIPWKNTMYLIGGTEQIGWKYAFKTDIWEWTGKTWTQVPGSRVPVLKLSNDAVADPVSKKIITIGGNANKQTFNLQNDTWSWDGKTWTKVSEGTKLEWHASQVSYALDSGKDQIFAVVAPEPGQPSKFPLQTWVLPASGNWTQLKPKNSPPGYKNYTRWVPRMTFHEALGVMVLGMETNMGMETWIWNGQDWRKDSSKLIPRTSLFCYNSRQKKVIAMEYETLNTRNMWAWDTKGWVKTHSAVSIPNLNDGYDDWAYDTSRDRIVMFYSVGSSATKYMTAEWDEKQWTIAERGGGKLSGARLFYSPGLGGVVACGGLDLASWPGLILPNTHSWLWDGKTWKKLVGPKLPSQRNRLMMQAFYDPGRQRGIAVYPYPVPSQLWEFRLDSMKASQQCPHPGEAFTMDVNMPTQAGNPFLLMFAGNTRPGIPLRKVSGVGTELLPLTPDPLFLLSLQLGLIAGLDTQGKARIPLRFPNDSNLLWLKLHMAGVTFDKTGVAAISDQVPITIVK